MSATPAKSLLNTFGVVLIRQKQLSRKRRPYVPSGNNMRWFQRLFSRESDKPVGPELDALISTFMRPMSAAEKRQFIKDHPELLSRDADVAFAALAFRQQSDSARAMIDFAREQLQRSRTLGVGAVWCDDEAETDAPDLNMVKVVDAFVTAGTLKERRAFLEEHPELLKVPARDLFPAGDERTATFLAPIWELLERSRAIGIEAAFREAEERAAEWNRTVKLASAFEDLLKTTTLAEKRRIVADNPELTEEDQLTWLRGYVTQVADEGLQSYIKPFFDLLDECRLLGVDTAFELRAKIETAPAGGGDHRLLHAFARFASVAEHNPKVNALFISEAEKFLAGEYTAPSSFPPYDVAAVRYGLAQAYIRLEEATPT